MCVTLAACVEPIRTLFCPQYTVLKIKENFIPLHVFLLVTFTHLVLEQDIVGSKNGIELDLSIAMCPLILLDLCDQRDLVTTLYTGLMDDRKGTQLPKTVEVCSNNTTQCKQRCA